MTREHAIEELELLQPKERLAWTACNAKLSERDEFEKQWLEEYNKLQNQWSPLYGRIQQLKTFIEIA